MLHKWYLWDPIGPFWPPPSSQWSVDQAIESFCHVMATTRKCTWEILPQRLEKGKFGICNTKYRGWNRTTDQIHWKFCVTKVTEHACSYARVLRPSFVFFWKDKNDVFDSILAERAISLSLSLYGYYIWLYICKYIFMYNFKVIKICKSHHLLTFCLIYYSFMYNFFWNIWK